MSMSFIIKKIISIFLMPLSVGLILSIWGLYYLYKNNIKKAKYLLSFSIIFIYIISITPFANMLISPLERSYSKLKTIPKNVDYILILGGETEFRAWEVLRLYNQNPNLKIITSGKSINGYSIAKKTTKILLSCGVKKDNIIRQDNPKDTVEEAIELKKRLGNSPFILVTSAYHMPRSIMIFKKYGLNPIPAPTDFKIKKKEKYSLIPKAISLRTTEVALHEYIGIAWLFLTSL